MDMQTNYFSDLIAKQRQFFASSATYSIDFRIKQLKLLKSIIEKNETVIAAALKQDLHKSPMEAIVNEVMLVIDEINFAIKHLRKWAKPKKVSASFPFTWPGSSKIYYEPYGCVLIMGAWNYPFLLIMSPLIGAISAGNCVIVKPSELAPSTEELIVKLINQHFSPDYLIAIKAGPADVDNLLKEKLDYIFFTGGTHIGKIIMKAAAKHLTPVTLELGGKSPCIIDASANLDFAARRIARAKTMNAGQVCIAPDYVYVNRANKDKLIQKIKSAWQQFYGDDAEKSDSYGRIINQKHFDRLSSLLQNGKIVVGGKTNPETRYIAPTIIDDVSWNDAIMQEEIFGPILPILTYDHLDEAIAAIRSRPKPLALYFFSDEVANQDKVLKQISFGGGCINDCLLQVANTNLPFGGVGPSGMGNYHGQYSFETFSHRKGIYKKNWLLDLSIEYPPYTPKKLWWIRQLFRVA